MALLDWLVSCSIAPKYFSFCWIFQKLQETGWVTRELHQSIFQSGIDRLLVLEHRGLNQFGSVPTSRSFSSSLLKNAREMPEFPLCLEY